MSKKSWFESPTPEEIYEPTIKYFSQGNMLESDYDKSMLNHDDDFQYSSEEWYEPMHHFSNE